MRTFGLIGFPLSHSFSQKFFTEKFERENITNCQYLLFPIKHVNQMMEIMERYPSLCGLNVTIPHKINVIPYLDEVDEAADAIGAVNCIVVTSGQKPFFKGYNTDVYGFSESLKPLLKPQHKKALVFGNGGAAQAVKYALTQLGITYLAVARNSMRGTIPYSAVTNKILEKYNLLINTTPLGMSPNLNSYPPIPFNALTEKHLVYDLVYNPQETIFLTKAKFHGAIIKNGLEMLYLQAEHSWEIWNRVV